MMGVTVPVTTLDDVLEGLGRVDILKIDVEGHELKVLEGGLRSLRNKKIKNILFESNPRMLKLASTSENEVSGLLSGFGYRESARIRHSGGADERTYYDCLMTLAN